MLSKKLTALTALLFIVASISGQSSSHFSAEGHVGLVSGSMHGAPISLQGCIEGCFPLQQAPLGGFQVEVGINWAFHEKQTIHLGLGFHEFKYEETGLGSRGTSTLFPYRSIVNFPYLSLIGSHRCYFLKGEKLDVYFANGLQTDWMLDTPHSILRTFGLSYLGNIGLEFRTRSKSSIVLSPSFRTAITRYNYEYSHQAFLPYGFGLSLGIKRNL